MLELIDNLIKNLDNTTQNFLVVLISIILGIFFRYIIYLIVKIYVLHTEHYTARMLQNRMKGALFIVLPAFFLLYLFPLIQMRPDWLLIFQRTVQIIFICSFSFMLIRLTYVAQDFIFFRFSIEKEDNFRERKLQTQVQFLRRIIILVIVVVAISLVFMRFEGMRKLGTGLLTSAGILGVILGFAAQKSLANLLAGLQIAFTQPIRIDDVVIVENEWGKIEEINMTYVVVRIWDNRRMVLPITYFIEKPFQNWTRHTADLLGTAMIYADYTLPVEEVRKKLQEVAAGSPLWDGEVCILQVTNATEKSMEIRALVSARNSSDLFDLRCLVREEIVAFIQEKYPQSLPRFRADFDVLKEGNLK